MSGDRWARGFTWAFGITLFLLGCAFGLQKIRTFDYWWHLRTGALISEIGSVPRTDVYSYTVQGAPWIDAHWLFQLALHGIYSLGGHEAVVIAKAASICGLLALVAAIGWRRGRPVITALALGLMLAVAADRFMPRPELPSFLLLASILYLLDRNEQRGDAWVFAIVPLQLIWANVHGLFAVGIAVCAMYAAAELLRPILQPDAEFRLHRLGRLCAVTALAAGVSLLNPNGLDGALYPIQQLGMIGPADERGLFGSLIAELVPPFAGRGRSHPLALGLATTLAGLSFGAMALNWRRLSGAHPLLWVAFVYLGLSARRNLALMAIVCAPILVRNLNEVIDRHPPSKKVLTWTSAVACVLLLVFGVDVARGSFATRTGSLREPGLGVSEIFYPRGAVEWIARHRPDGPLCHHMADGGYVIWSLYPDYRVMSDGRLEIYGAERFAELQVTGPDRFRELDEKYRFGAVLVHYSLISSEELLRWLHLNTNWRLVFVDQAAAVFVRVEGGVIPRWAEIDVDAPDLFDSGETEVGPVGRAHIMARTNWFVSFHRFDRALAEWEKLLERYPGTARSDTTHAMLLARTGKAAAAEVILRRLLAEKPEDKVLAAQVGDLRFENGDLEGARELYERALLIDQRFYYAVLRRAALAEAQGDPGYAAMLYTQVMAGTPPLDPHRGAAARRLAVIGGL